MHNKNRHFGRFFLRAPRSRRRPPRSELALLLGFEPTGWPQKSGLRCRF